MTEIRPGNANLLNIMIFVIVMTLIVGRFLTSSSFPHDDLLVGIGLGTLAGDIPEWFEGMIRKKD